MQVASNLRSVVNALTTAEPLFALLGTCLFFRAKEGVRFPALRNFLVFRTLSATVLALVYNSSRFGVDRRTGYVAYFNAYWVCYIASAILIFFVIQEMYRHVMSPLPGISRLGLLAFRWAATISMIVAVASAVLPAGFKERVIIAASIEFMRCISIMELSLLVLLAFSVHSLGLSFRSRAFGVGLGFGFTAFMDFVTSAFAINGKTMNSYANVIAGVVTTVGLLTWSAYFLLPEDERKPLTLPMSSPLMRWNEIAMALGHASPQVAVVPASQFFLQDVESVVDKMLTKNAMNTASEG
ncbi:MAG TPA: hypothetical protein VGD64_04810 [Acidisarcina sp.]